MTALASLDMLKLKLGITDDSKDALLVMELETASGRILSALCCDDLVYEEDRVEYVQGFGTQLIHLRLTPVSAITSIEFIDTLGTAHAIEGWAIDNPKTGAVRRLGSVWSHTGLATPHGDIIAGTQTNRYKVTYNGGYITAQQATDGLGTRNLPYELEAACLQLAIRQYKGSHHGAVKSRRILSTNITYANTHIEGGLPADVYGMIKKHTKVVI